MEIKLNELKEVKLKKEIPLIFPFFEGEKIDLKGLKLSKEVEKALNKRNAEQDPSQKVEITTK